ncbi:MAG: polysaccharide deacetylase [Rubrivivax sp. SCN 70-15]|nr:MAG: polysaccharide deacetylase [Rubrivivax sp. SCN 70-15]
MGLLARGLSPAGARARLSVLILHRVLPAPDPLFPGEIDARFFDALCRWVTHWFHVLPLAEATRRLRDGTLPAAAMAITFDDGYADNHDVALPILQRHGLRATFFIASGFLDGGRMWNDTVIEAVRCSQRDRLDLGALGVRDGGHCPLDSPAGRRRAIEALIGALKYLGPAARDAAVQRVARACAATLPNDLMMSSAQVRALRAGGMQVGGHTVSHPILARLTDAEARAEIQDGKHALEALLDAPVTAFAYPNGKPGTDYAPTHARMAREAGFELACSTAWGSAGQATEPFQLPRFTPWDRTRLRFGARLLGNLRRTPG